MVRLLFIRHAESEENLGGATVAGRLARGELDPATLNPKEEYGKFKSRTDGDSPLTKLGHAQAEKLGPRRCASPHPRHSRRQRGR